MPKLVCKVFRRTARAGSGIVSRTFPLILTQSDKMAVNSGYLWIPLMGQDRAGKNGTNMLE